MSNNIESRNSSRSSSTSKNTNSSRDSIWVFAQGIDNPYHEDYRPQSYLFSEQFDTLYTLSATPMASYSDRYASQTFEVQCWDRSGKLLASFFDGNTVRMGYQSSILLQQVVGRTLLIYRPHPEVIKIVALPECKVLDSLSVPYYFPVGMCDDSLHLGSSNVAFYDLRLMRMTDTSQAHFRQAYTPYRSYFYQGSKRCFQSTDSLRRSIFVFYDASNPSVLDTERVDLSHYFASTPQSLFGYSRSASASGRDTIWQYLPFSTKVDSIVVPCAIASLKVFDNDPYYIVMSPQRELYAINYQSKEVYSIGLATHDGLDIDQVYGTICYLNSKHFTIYSVADRKVVRRIAAPPQRAILDFNWKSNGLLFAYDSNNVSFVATPRDTMMSLLDSSNTYQLSNRLFNAVLSADSSDFYIIHNQAAFFRYASKTKSFDGCIPAGGIDFVIEHSMLLDSSHIYIGGRGLVGHYRDRIIDLDGGLVANMLESPSWSTGIHVYAKVPSNDSLIVASLRIAAGSARVGHYNWRTKSFSRSCEDNGYVYDMSKDTRILICHADSNRIHYIDLFDSTQTKYIAINFVVSSAYLSADTKSIAFRTQDGQIGLVSVATGLFSWIDFTSSKSELLLGFSPGGTLICTTSNLYSPEHGKIGEAQWPDYTTPFRFLRWMKGDSLVVGSTSYARVLWNVHTNEQHMQSLQADYYCIPQTEAYVESFSEKTAGFHVRKQTTDSLISSADLPPIPVRSLSNPSATLSTLAKPLMISYKDSSQRIIIWRLASQKQDEVGVNDQSQADKSLDYYPSPACQRICLKNAEQWLNSEIRIFNSAGECVVSQLLYSNSIDLSQLCTGAFCVQLSNEERFCAFKVVKSCP